MSIGMCQSLTRNKNFGNKNSILVIKIENPWYNGYTDGYRQRASQQMLRGFCIARKKVVSW